MAVRFVLNGSAVEVAEAEAHTTLLQWLRARSLCGTKEGCGEGECGACAVALVVSDPGEAGSRFEPVNSCLLPLLALDGREVISIEGIAAPDGALHPVQRAMVEAGGSQCGYCTPGFVVSLFCEYYREGRTGFDPESISGNLCRCTGYRPIADVARSLSAPAPNDARLLQLRRRSPDPPSRTELHFDRPTTLDEACALLRLHPSATIIAGGTDLMVHVNQRHRRFERVVTLESVAELQQLRATADELVIGAGVTLSRLQRWLTTAAPDATLLEQLLPLFSSRLIRNRATLGGNLATASPIGDAAPALLALGARLEIASEAGSRTMPLSEFFRDYRRTALEPGELICAIVVPRPFPQHQRFYKVSKRVLDDISTVAAAIGLSLDGDGLVRRLAVAFGGIASTPLTAPSLERLALGKPWNEATLSLVVREAEQLGTPRSDLRGSAHYRRAMTGKLLEKFFYDTHLRPEAAQ